MRIIRGLEFAPAEAKGAAIALGNFDGVHLGHQEILKACVAAAHEKGVLAAVMTFEPHPREFLAHAARLRICPFRRKAELLAELGVELILVMRFNRQLSEMSAADFVRDVLKETLRVRHVVTGYNFAFGKDRRGDTAFLDQEAVRLGFGYSACPPVFDSSGGAVSSSNIRKLLAAGDVEAASVLLGRPYEIAGPVIRGEQRGSRIGFPTANLSLKHLFMPRFGVYAVRLAIGDEHKWHEGVANLGIRPTFSGREPLLEVHALNLDRDLYGQKVRVRMIEFLREEIRFDNIEALKVQIAADCATAKDIMKRKKILP